MKGKCRTLNQVGLNVLRSLEVLGRSLKLATLHEGGYWVEPIEGGR